MTEEFDIGKRGLTVTFDRPRELIFNLKAFRAMEDLAHQWAKKSGLSLGVISTQMIMSNLGNDTFFSIAIWGGLRKESPQMKMEEVDDLYDAYLENTGDRTELVDSLLEAYARAKNPRQLRTLQEMEEIKKDALEKTASPGAGEEPSNGE